MNRHLLNRAIAIGVAVFLAIMAYEVVTAPRGGMRTLFGSGQSTTPIDLIDAALSEGGPTHQTWHRVALMLLRDDDPLAALHAFDRALDPDVNRNDAVSAYTAYYLGYQLMTQGRTEKAELAWELAVSRFEGWDDVKRPHLHHNDTIYHARTLMRLGRDSEAYEILRTVPGVAGQAPVRRDDIVLLARTLAEIGHQGRAEELLYDSLGQETRQSRIAALVRESAGWSRSGEELAMVAVQSATARALVPVLAETERFDNDLYRVVRDNAVILRRVGEDELSGGVAAAAAAAAERAARERDDGEAWFWAARFHAIAGDPAAAAGSLAAAPPGSLRADDLVGDWDLRRYMGREDMRTSVRLHGEPDEWPDDNEAP